MHLQLTGGSQPCSCVSPGDLTVLSGSAAAPRESKCQLSCHIQTALAHRESFCIVMWKMQSSVPLPEISGNSISFHCWYFLRWLGLSLWEGSD